MINNKPLKAQRQKDRQRGIEREVEVEALLIGLCSLVGSLYILDYFVHILGFSSWSHMCWVFFLSYTFSADIKMYCSKMPGLKLNLESDSE